MPIVIASAYRGADLIFPTSLPPPTLAGYGNRFSDSSVRTERDLGPDRIRQEEIQPIRLETVSWDFSEAQFNEFEYWYEVHCRGGISEFDIVLSDYSESVAWSTAKFIGHYRSENLQPGFRWRVDADLALFGSAFYNRTGPTLLAGRAYMTGRATATFDPIITLHGRAGMSGLATGALNVGSSLHGRAEMSGLAIGRLQPAPLHGRADMSGAAILIDLDLWSVGGTDIVSTDGVDQVYV